MKERPILFSTDMVKAILEGRKTQTRRIIKPRNESGLFQVGIDKQTGKVVTIWACDGNEQWEYDMSCPYGDIGNTLWVRETWSLNPFFNETEVHDNEDHDIISNDEPYLYKAKDKPFEGHKWRPSIFMPRKAARIFLEVTGIRVERLQEINEEDAKAEGIQADFWEEVKSTVYRDYMTDTKGYGNPEVDYPVTSFPIDSFKSLWQSINGEESWEENPFVWVIEFKKL